MHADFSAINSPQDTDSWSHKSAMKAISGQIGCNLYLSYLTEKKIRLLRLTRLAVTDPLIANLVLQIGSMQALP
jgi:hypothetical protein